MTWLNRISNISNWFYKIAEHKDVAILLVRGNVEYSFDYLHGEWIEKYLNVHSNYSSIMRYALPRGRISETYYSGRGAGIMIECSKELEPYKSQLISDLKITPMDRPQWHFSSMHYRVVSENEAINMLMSEYQYWQDLSQLKTVDNVVLGLSSKVLSLYNEIAEKTY